MASLNEANVERKFQQVNNTQDSIQSLSLWVIHHKAHHEKIVGIWLKVLKKAATKQRLTLFYLCNDIVQTCKRKHAIVFKDAFKERLKEAVIQVRDPSIRPNVERMLKIWVERGIYDQTFIDELGDIVSNNSSKAVITTLLDEFQPEQALEKIASFAQLESENAQQEAVVSNLRLDASHLENIKQLKDRDKGREYSQQFEDGCVKLEVFVSNKEIESRERTSLIELLEQSELFYNAQYKEAKIVANAYKNFGTRVFNLRKKLVEHTRRLPSPVPSPEPDAPSPEQSPEYPPLEDNTEAIDMEMSDEEANTPAVVETSKGSRKRKSEDSTTFKPSFYTNRSESREEDSSGWKHSRSSHRDEKKSRHSRSKDRSPRHSSNHKSSSSTNQTSSRTVNQEVSETKEQGDSTPVKDEHVSTPVQDESPEDSISSNPIEFLTQLIAQTKNTNPNSQPSSFLQSLTSFKPAAEANSEVKDSASAATNNPTDTWSAWKNALSTPQPVPAPVQSTYDQSAPPPPPVPPPNYAPPEGVPPPAGYVPPSPQPQPPYNQPPAAPMMVPPPPYPPSIMPATGGTPAPLNIPPPPMGMAAPPPPNISSWPPPLGGPVPPPVGPPPISVSNNSMLPPPISSSYAMPPMHQTPPAPHHQLTPPGLGPPPQHNSVSKMQYGDEIADDKTPSPNFSGGPARPAFPPSSPINPRPPPGPPPPPSSHNVVADAQQEFIEKLKRKSTLTSPTNAPANINLMRPDQHVQTVNSANNPASGGDQMGSAGAGNTQAQINNPDNPASMLSSVSGNEMEKKDENAANPNDQSVQRIQSVGTRVTRNEGSHRFDTHGGYERRGSYGENQYNQYGDYKYDNYQNRDEQFSGRDSYYRDNNYGRPSPKRSAPPQSYERRPYYPY